MLNPKIIVAILLGVNIIAFLSSGVDVFIQLQNKRLTKQDYTVTEALRKTPRFYEPQIAFQILQRQDIFEPIPLNFVPGGGARYGQIVYGLKNDDQYCEKHRALVVENPEFLFTEMNFVTNYGKDSCQKLISHCCR